MRVTQEQLLADIQTTRDLKVRYGTLLGNVTGGDDFATAQKKLTELYNQLYVETKAKAAGGN